VRGCCFVVICIVLVEDGWVGTADADSIDGPLYHRRGGTLFQLQVVAMVWYEVVAKGRLTEGGTRCGNLTISCRIVGMVG
jgi:hypothetical protein